MKRQLILVASLAFSMMVCAQTKEAAVLFSNGSGLDDSYLLTENVSVVFDNEGKGTICKGETATKVSDLDLTTPVTAEFRNAFNITATQYPEGTVSYYATFYSEEGAYKLPETAKAYIGTISDKALNLTSVDNIRTSEPVVLKATGSSFTLMPSANTATARTNALTGTEEGKTLGTDEYALAIGNSGLGFYKLTNALGANKAYLTYTASAGANAFKLMFDDDTTTGLTPQLLDGKQSTGAFDLNGMKVSEYKNGYIIKDGRTYYKPKK